MDDSDTLLRKAIAGDADALARLLDQHAPEIERGLSIGREWQSVLEPADVMQVTYFEAFLQIAHFDPDRAEPFTTWLQRIAENNLRDAIRGLQRQKRPPPARRVSPRAGEDSSSALLDLLGVTNTTPSRQADRETRTNRLNAALDSLPDDYARAVRLYDLQALPIEEVTKTLGRSPGAVHMLRARAHDRLRELLGAPSAWFSSSA